MISELAEVVQTMSSKVRMLGFWFRLFDSTVSDIELRTIWTDIIYARQELRADKIFIKGDFTIIICWIRDEVKHLNIHPLLRDI